MELNTKPSITPNGAMLGFFFVMLRGFFEDKTACVLFAFLFCSPLGLEDLNPFGSLLLQERIANTLAFASSRHKIKAG